MPHTKIATCCYCGNRAALVLTGQTRHELACGSCGAPLSRLKMLPIHPERAPARPAPLKHSRPAPGPSRPLPQHRSDDRKPSKKSRLARKALSGIWDIVEDIFD